MYTLIRALSMQALVLQQAPALIGSFVIASVFYKWGSFALEFMGWLITWSLFDLVTSLIYGDRLKGSADA